MQQDEQEARESSRQPLSELYKKAEPDREQREPPQPLPGGIPVTPQPVTETEIPVTDEQQAEQERTVTPERLSRLEKLERQKIQIENKIKALHARESEKERKGRTRRLIQIGALSEKYLNCEGIEPKEYEALLKQLVTLPEVKAILKRG